MLGFGGDPVPRDKRDLIASLAAEFEGMRLADSERLNRYKEYRKENEAAREVDLFSRAQGGDYGRDTSKDVDGPPRHYIPLPFGQALTVKHSHRVAGRLPDAMVDRREETAEERYRSDTMEKIWWAILHASGGETLFGSGAWDGSQLGATVFEPYWNFEKQMPMLRALDPAGVLVVRGLDDPHDFQRVYRYWQTPVETARAEYRNLEIYETSVNVEEMESTHKQGGVDMATLVECKTKTETVRFCAGVESHAVPLIHDRHDHGFVPLVVIPNIGPYRDVWGWADYEFVRGLVAYMPQLLSREADVLRMVANGAMIEKGTGQDPSEVKKIVGNGGVLPSKRDGSVEGIEPPEMPSFAPGHGDRVMELIKMLGFAPDASWGGSDTRSGADRALQLQPLLELTAMKQTNWGAGLSRLGSMMYQMIEKKQLKPTTYRGVRPGATPGQRKPFKPFQIGPTLEPLLYPVETTDPVTGDESVEELALPRTPRELFDGDYAIRFIWQNRIDPDDPAFVLSELNKFAQGAQSLYTTLTRLGFQAPEDEIKLIEEEAERIPWLRQGMIALLMMQLREQNGAAGIGQGAGGGAPVNQSGGLLGALGMTQNNDGAALDADAGAAGLPGGLGQLFGGA